MPSHPLDPDTAGFVLAGGQSSRMGQDKALLTFGGQSLAARALSLLRDAGLQPALAGADTSLASVAPIVEDRDHGLGPLSGICAALCSTSALHAVFLPVDLPFIPASLIAFLLHHARITGRPVTLPSVNGFAQTFPVVLDRGVLPALAAELAAGRRGCYSAFQSAAASMGQSISIVPVELLVQPGQLFHPLGMPAVRWFLNLNTQADLALAQAFSAQSRIA